MAASRMNSFSVCDTSADRFEDGEIATQPKHQECHANGCLELYGLCSIQMTILCQK